MENPNSHPKVSVLIPTYNYGEFLEETIESVLRQTFTDFEILVVDNNSSDETDEVIKKFLGYSNFRFIKNDKNLGMSGNWNKCLQLAKGKYLKFLCADDKLHPSNLEKLVKVLDSDPDVIIVSSYFEYFGESTELIKYPFSGEHKGSDIVKYNLIEHNIIGTPTQVIFRADNLWVGTFKSELLWINDTDMWNRLLMQGNYYCIPEVLSYVRSHAGQATVSVLKNFSAIFDGYTYLKYVELTNQFDIVKYPEDFNNALKEKAFNLASAIPGMIIAKRRDLLNKAISILYAERLLLRSLSFLTAFFLKSAIKKAKRALS